MALRRRDIHLPTDDNGTPAVEVKKAVAQLNSGAQHVKNPKGSKAGVRLVSLPAAILPEPRMHMKDYAEAGNDGRVFVGPKGGTPRRSNFNRIWKRALKASSANPELHLHDLRHTGGTLSAQTGATLREIMSRLGHSTARAAMIYQHATGERDKKIAQALSSQARLRPRSRDMRCDLVRVVGAGPGMRFRSAPRRNYDSRYSETANPADLATVI